ncbi:hypothetical protein QE152_g24350 [Popillia japonica]|uniref:Uncharacterized protein n=1 Tax=Popillia japonica TaxID=7064 RepID=A0AAW1KG26_POPJA
MAEASRGSRGYINVLQWNMDGYGHKIEEVDVLTTAAVRRPHCIPERDENKTGSSLKPPRLQGLLEKTQHPRTESIRLELGDGIGLTSMYNSPRLRLTEAAMGNLFD